jgi:NADH-quinone oxidoreductase subunit F
MLDLLEKLCGGQGRREHLGELEALALQVGQGSLCGLGKTAPNPVLTTLRYFREEYEAHLQGRCLARRCTALIRYSITEDCTGCTLCAQHCPVDAIPVVPYQRHRIDQQLCTRCDSCRRVCPHQAVEVT